MGKLGVPQLWTRGQQAHAMTQELGSQYWRKVVSIRPGSLYAYWPIWEPSGTDVQDYSGLGDRATSTGLGDRAAGPDGVHQAAEFKGSPSHVNLLSAEFVSRFNGLEGTLLVWLQAATAGLWTDGLERIPIWMAAPLVNFIAMSKGPVNNEFSVWVATSLGYNHVTKAAFAPGTSWFMYGMTWSTSANQLKAFYNGVQDGATSAILGAFAGALNLALLGSQSTTATKPWLGYLAHVALWNVPLSASEIKSFSEV